MILCNPTREQFKIDHKFHLLQSDAVKVAANA